MATTAAISTARRAGKASNASNNRVVLYQVEHCGEERQAKAGTPSASHRDHPTEVRPGTLCKLASNDSR